jgi:prepilin-type processing-associated H-X9-DG protein
MICVTLALLIGFNAAVSSWAQTNAAQQAVRQRVSGLEGGTPGEVVPNEAVPPGVSPATSGLPAAGPNTRYIPPTAAAVVILRPAQLLTAPIAELFPTEVASAAGLQYLGVNPADVDEATVFLDQINPIAPMYGATIKFNKPFRASSLPPRVRPFSKLADFNGKKYLQSANTMWPSFYGVNSQTLVIAPDPVLRNLIETHEAAQSGGLIDRVRQTPTGNDLYIAVNVAALRPLIQMGLSQSPAKEQAQQAEAMLNGVAAAEVTLNLAGPGPISVVLHANDETSAQQLEQTVAAVAMMLQSPPPADPQTGMVDPVQQALAQYKQRMSQFFQPRRTGTAVTCFYIDGQNQTQKQIVGAALIGTIAASALPAMRGAQHATAGGGAAMNKGAFPALLGADRAPGDDSVNNMKQLALALLNFASAKAMLPPHAIYSQEGQPLLSWRVAILPFIEQQALYNQFKLDEPWDSEHNRSLIAQMPDVFKSPNAPLEPGKTNYLALVGEPCVMNGTQQGMKLRQISDGTSNTVSIVEANADQAVEWTKPDDLEFDPNNPLNGVGSVVPGGFNAAFVDGSVKGLQNVPPETVKALFTRNGGEAISVNAQPSAESTSPGTPGAP